MRRTSMLMPVLVAGLVACEPGSSGTVTTDLTWHQDIAPVVAQRCAGCHQEGGIGAFPLTTYDQVVALAGPMELAVASGTMPPWQGADGCNDYANDFSLTGEEEAALLEWLASDLPEGDEATAAPPTALEPMDVDLVLQLPEPYTPSREPDDQRCQLIEWPEDETSFITGLEVHPDVRSIVHHAIVFATSAEGAQAFRDMDAAEEGPGYTCFGGPAAGGEVTEDRSDWSYEQVQEAYQNGELGAGFIGTKWLGAWVPGVQSLPAPEGTGIRMEPGDVLIVQMHYNTLSAEPVADQSSVAFQVADAVEREAMILPFTDIGWFTGIGLLGGPMSIPAGEAEVIHETSSDAEGFLLGYGRSLLGLPEGSPMVIHEVGHHMHLLGKTGRQELRREDGGSVCLVDIPDWDFGWQGSFRLAEPVTVTSTDQIYLGCSWDNSAANQPIVDGEVQAPRDVAWGDNSTDEMCLSTLYVTGP